MNIINTKVRRLDSALIERFKKISPSELGHALEFGFMNRKLHYWIKERHLCCGNCNYSKDTGNGFYYGI